MTHPSREASRARGRLRELYHFWRGVEDWRYTSYRTRLAFHGELWEPLPITRSEIEVGSEDRPGVVDVTVPTSSGIGTVLQAGSAPTPISLRIYQFHQGIVDDYAIIFNGEVQAADIEGETCVIQAVPLQARMSMVLPRGLYQRERCTWNTYDPLTCGKSTAGFLHTGAVTAINGLQVAVAGAAAFNADPAFFALGVMMKGEWKAPIQSQSEDSMALDFMIPGLIVGDTVTILAGDDRTKETCLTKYDNIERYMAFSQMPIQSPFEGQGLRS
jgi:hypothetical protein